MCATKGSSKATNRLRPPQSTVSIVFLMQTRSDRSYCWILSSLDNLPSWIVGWLSTIPEKYIITTDCPPDPMIRELMDLVQFFVFAMYCSDAGYRPIISIWRHIHLRRTALKVSAKTNLIESWLPIRQGNRRDCLKLSRNNDVWNNWNFISRFCMDSIVFDNSRRSLVDRSFVCGLLIFLSPS